MPRAKAQEKKYAGMTVKSWVAVGAVGVGAYLLWKNLSGRGGPVFASATVPAQLPPQTDSMLPGTTVPAAAGMVQPSRWPAGVQPGAQTNSGMVPPMTQPSQGVTQSQYPYPVQPVPVPTSTVTTSEQYLAILGNPKPGTTVKGSPPPAGMFPDFKGSAGPKQKKCTKDGGVWTGPTGKKFCVMP